MAKVTSTPYGIHRPQRWDQPFGDDMTSDHVEELLKVQPFCDFDADRFPSRLSLHDILLNDTRIRRYREGDIVVREGDYGNSAFYVLKGTVRVALESLPAEVLGRRKQDKKSFFQSLSQLWTNPREQEVRAKKSVGEHLSSRDSDESSSGQTVFIQDVPAVFSDKKSVQLVEGQLFGEMAALGRTSRTATIIAEGEDAELLEIRWQGLREIRQYAPEWKKHIDELYRSRSLSTHLSETPLLKGLSKEALAEVVEATQFETYGNFDWHTTYEKMRKESRQRRHVKEPMISAEGEYPNGLVLIRNGFARVSYKYNNGERTVSYLGKGETFGLPEIAYNSSHKEPMDYQHSLRALGYVDILVIPTSVVEDHILPTIPQAEIEQMQQELLEAKDAPLEEDVSKVPNDTLEFLVENRYINGTATMLIDLDRCTRCDDCVRACAESHGGNPRFIRQGPQMGNLMVANACMHCVDPVCMIGCPTGAIHRDAAQGQVVINDSTCIGCATCANSCPYSNIHMVDIRNEMGDFVLDEEKRVPIQEATKCDLCYDQLGGPSCARACPHDAMARADMRDLDKLAEWLNR